MPERSTPTAPARAALLAALLLVAGCFAPSDGVSASASGILAYPLELPPITPPVTLGDYWTANSGYFSNPQRPVTLVVVFAEGGTVKSLAWNAFKTAHPDWSAWRVKGYSPGFESPTFPPSESDHYKWLATNLVDKGGEVGVIVEPPAMLKVDPGGS